jgi:serine/threonine protein phosphatase PrpC
VTDTIADEGRSAAGPPQGAMPRGEHASDECVVREAVLTQGWTRLDAAVASSPGRRHAVNEDGYSTLDATAPLFVVADGVSSGAMASCASRELVARLHAALGVGRIDADAMKSAILDADREIGRTIASRTDAPGAATVALCAGTNASLSRWLVAWVGDCRVYRLSAAPQATAELLTADDTYRHLNEQSPLGGSPDDPARMVGNGAVDAPNVRSITLAADEMLVLCSDGVHKHAGAHDIGRVLRGPAPLAHRCAGLIEFARARGSSDDATVLVLHRARRSRGRTARFVSLGALIALTTGALVWLAADRAGAQRFLTESLPHTVQVQP